MWPSKLWRVKAKALAPLLFLLPIAAACAQVPTPQPVPDTGAAPTPKEGGTLVVAVEIEGDGLLFPLFTAYTVMGQVLDLIYDPLIRLNDKSEYIAAVAKQVPTVENGGISSDGLTYVFPLRSDVKFHDGQRLTCKDVEFTYLTGKNRNVKVRYANDFELIESVTCRDDFTVVFRLSHPYLPFLITASNYSILPRHVLEKESDINETQLLQRPLGSGPFKFKERVPGSHIVLERNPDYFQGRPRLEQIVYRIIPDVNTALAQVQRGEIDIWSDFPASQAEVVKGLKDYEVHRNFVMWQEFMSFNLLDPKMADKRLRQALAYATDRDAIISLVYRGVAAPNPASPLVPTNQYFRKDIKDYKYDADRAKALLEEAGWKVASDGIRVKDGQRLTVEIQASAAARLRAVELIVDQWRKIGVEGKLMTAQSAVLFRNRVDHKFEAAISPYPQFNEVDMRVLLHSKESYGGVNYAAWRNPEVDKLLDEAATVVDRTKKKQLYDKVQEIYADELPFYPLFQQVVLYGLKNNVHNFKFNPNRDQMKSDFWNAHELWKE